MASGLAVGIIETIIVPKPALILLLLGAMILDLILGIWKSWSKGIATTSSGFRKTVNKLAAYMGAVLGMWFLAMLCSTIYKQTAFDYSHLVNGTIGFLTFIELYSIFENIYEIDPNSMLSRYFIKRVLKLLRGKLINDHPLKTIEDDEEQS